MAAHAITDFDKRTATSVCDEILKVLNDHFKDRNIKFDRNSGSYNDTSVKLQVTASVVRTAAGVAVKSKDELEYEHLRMIHKSLPPCGTVFKHGTDTFRIIGASLRSPKFPVKCIEASGTVPRKFKFSVQSIVSARP